MHMRWYKVGFLRVSLPILVHDAVSCPHITPQMCWLSAQVHAPRDVDLSMITNYWRLVRSYAPRNATGASSHFASLGISAFLRTWGLDTALDTSLLMNHLTKISSSSVIDFPLSLSLSLVQMSSSPVMSPAVMQITEVSSLDDIAAYEEQSFDSGKIPALFPAPLVCSSWDECVMVSVAGKCDEVSQAYAIVPVDSS
jgi:hypothetical protein